MKGRGIRGPAVALSGEQELQMGCPINSGRTALNGGSWRDDIPQAFFGIDNKNDSDVMQTLKGAGKGAMMGTMVFPGVGTAIGALLGAGASFLDDI